MSTHAIDVEPIDRLAEKVRGLISILERVRGELSQTVEENLRLSRDVEDLKAQMEAQGGIKTWPDLEQSVTITFPNISLVSRI